jgi:hypothetical protein
MRRLDPITAVNDFRAGLGYGFPLCCVLRFSFDTLIGRDDQAVRRGGVDDSPVGAFVTCNVFHHGDPYPYGVWKDDHGVFHLTALKDDNGNWVENPN